MFLELLRKAGSARTIDGAKRVRNPCGAISPRRAGGALGTGFVHYYGVMPVSVKLLVLVAEAATEPDESWVEAYIVPGGTLVLLAAVAVLIGLVLLLVWLRGRSRRDTSAT